MSEAMSRPRSHDDVPFDAAGSRPRCDPFRPYGLVLDSDGRILLVDRADEPLDRQFSQVTTVPLHARTAARRRRLPAGGNDFGPDAQRGA